jgi:hypothetical protein
MTIKQDTVNTLLIKAKEQQLITDYLIEDDRYTISTNNRYFVNLTIDTTYNYLTSLLNQYHQ